MRGASLALLAALALASGCGIMPVPAAPGPSSPTAAEAVPASPGPDFVWVPGHWTWHQDVQTWVAGAWLLPPRPGYGWQPGHWVARGPEQIWLDGYWSPR